MSTFIMLTRLAHGTLTKPEELETLEKQAVERIGSECPKVEWPGSYAMLGPCDYLDVFQAPDIETATRVSTIVRTYGHAQTEVWAATEWQRFKDIIRDIASTATA
jgi:uncharacterized protein with GYD domain